MVESDDSSYIDGPIPRDRSSRTFNSNTKSGEHNMPKNKKPKLEVSNLIHASIGDEV